MKSNQSQTVFLTNSTVTIETNSTENFRKEFSVYNSIGQLITVTPVEVAMNKFQFDFSNYSSGIYFIRILENNQSIVKRVIIQHDF